MTPRIYTPPFVVLDMSAPFWNGDTARRVIKQRVRQYEKEKLLKTLARRKAAAARARQRGR